MVWVVWLPAGSVATMVISLSPSLSWMVVEKLPELTMACLSLTVMSESLSVEPETLMVLLVWP